MNSVTRSSLIHSAVPTVFNVPNPPKVLALKRPTPSDRSQMPADKKLRSDEPAAADTARVQASSPAAVSDVPLAPRKAELTSKLSYSRKCLARARTYVFISYQGCWTLHSNRTALFWLVYENRQIAYSGSTVRIQSDQRCVSVTFGSTLNPSG